MATLRVRDVPGGRAERWGVTADPNRHKRSACCGNPEPKALKPHSTMAFMWHGGTRASYNWSYWLCANKKRRPTIFDEYRHIMALKQTDAQAARFNMVQLQSFTAVVFAVASLIMVRVFHINNAIQVAAGLVLIHMMAAPGTVEYEDIGPQFKIFENTTGLDPHTQAMREQTRLSEILNAPLRPFHKAIDDFDDHISTLTHFVLGLFVSLVLARLYYAQRGYLGKAFSAVLAFTTRIIGELKPPGAARGELVELPSEVMHTELTLIRWLNAVFRLLWLECCDYDKQIDGDLSIMQGSLGPLLTEAEWRRVRNLPSRCTHIISWANTSLQDLRAEGYLTDDAAADLAQYLDDLRSSNVWGLSGLPYPYVFLVTLLVKVNIVFIAFQAAVHCQKLNKIEVTMEILGRPQLAWEFYTAAWVTWLGFAIRAWLYQALVDLYVMLRNPNQGVLAGHMPTPTFLQFTEAVTFGMYTNQGAMPRPFYHKVDPMDAPSPAAVAEAMPQKKRRSKKASKKSTAPHVPSRRGKPKAAKQAHVAVDMHEEERSDAMIA